MNKSNSLDLFCITKSTIIKFLFPVFFSASLQAQIYTGTVFQPVEISFESLFEYSHPHRDVEIWAEFSNENGQN